MDSQGYSPRASVPKCRTKPPEPPPMRSPNHPNHPPLLLIALVFGAGVALGAKMVGGW